MPAAEPGAGGRTRRIGPLGEAAAARFLARHGLVVLDRNVRSRLGEIDLIALDGATLVFVEVKTRRVGAREPPQVAVTGRKRARLARAALGYLAARRLAGRPGRFDVVAVTVAETGEVAAIRHLPGAFVVDGWAG